SKETQMLIQETVQANMFVKRYQAVFTGDERWQNLKIPKGEQYDWNNTSTYVKLPRYFEGMKQKPPKMLANISNARVLAILGDSVTTDHISPAGNIAKNSPAGEYLQQLGIAPADFNSYGSRRGNHEVMMRGTFANIRLKNQLVRGTEGNWTLHLPSGEKMSIFDAAMRYQQEHCPLILMAGKEYGSGSSRDWAAKGPRLLGVQAVIAESFERIHRSNLIGMGVLPLQFKPNENVTTLNLSGREIYNIDLENLRHRGTITIHLTTETGEKRTFSAIVRIDTPKEMEYYRHGGILHYVLRQLLEKL
ncbi:MAG TPA: aconitate hydratase, partial [Gammaproteobacteria bacterium]|nr:aconitate hydratase [Gammaproteobacteria bacterium]